MKPCEINLHFLMILISEIKESGDVETQLWRILQKKKYQTQTTHAAQEKKKEVWWSRISNAFVFIW